MPAASFPGFYFSFYKRRLVLPFLSSLNCQLTRSHASVDPLVSSASSRFLTNWHLPPCRTHPSLQVSLTPFHRSLLRHGPRRLNCRTATLGRQRTTMTLWNTSPTTPTSAPSNISFLNLNRLRPFSQLGSRSRTTSFPITRPFTRTLKLGPKSFWTKFINKVPLLKSV